MSEMTVISPKPFLQAVKIAAKIALMNKITPDRIVLRLTYNNAKAVVEATSVEQSCRISVVSGAVDNSEPETILIQPQILQDILTKCSGSDIYIERKDDTLIIEDSDRNRWNILLPSQNLEFYLNIETNPEHYYMLSGVALRDMLPLALASTSASDTLMGVTIQAANDYVAIVGTDGNRMAVCRQNYEEVIENPSQPEYNLDALISVDFCRLILSVINNSSIMKECFETVPVTQTEKAIQFEFDTDELEIVLSSQPFCGKKIPYENILESVKLGCSVTVKPDSLLQALTAVSAIQDKKIPVVQINMNPNNPLTLQSYSRELGSADSSCEIDEYKGDGVTRTSSYITSYLTQFLRVLDKDAPITLKMTPYKDYPPKLSIITTSGCYYVVMPTVNGQIATS